MEIQTIEQHQQLGSRLRPSTARDIQAFPFLCLYVQGCNCEVLVNKSRERPRTEGPDRKLTQRKRTNDEDPTRAARRFKICGELPRPVCPRPHPAPRGARRRREAQTHSSKYAHHIGNQPTSERWIEFAPNVFYVLQNRYSNVEWQR